MQPQAWNKCHYGIKSWEGRKKILNCHSSDLLLSEGEEGAEHLISLSSAV